MTDGFDAKAENDKLDMHIQQVELGMIPADSPSGFTLPQPLRDGLPWWFGGRENFQPTPEALAAAQREWEERQGPHAAE